jgi:hypothetical protein
MEVPKVDEGKEPVKMEDEYECQPSTSSFDKEQNVTGSR